MSGRSVLNCTRAGAADEAALRALLRDNAMESWVNLTFEREPDWFAGSRLMGESVPILARYGPEETVGMYTHAWLPVHISGQAAQAGYLGGLRVHQAYRQRIRVLRQGYASVPRFFPLQPREENRIGSEYMEHPPLSQRGAGGDSADAGHTHPVQISLPPQIPPNPPLEKGGTGLCRFTSIARDNAPARRVLEAGLPGLPRYQPVGELVTLALPVPPFWRSPRLQLTPATPEDIPALAETFNRAASAWQFAPHLSEAWLASLDGSNGLRLNDFLLLKHQGHLVAAVALWDQRAFKQTCIHAYRFPLGLARPFWNAWAGLSGGIPLPAPGRCLEQIHLAFTLLPESPELTRDVITAALHAVRGRGGRLGVLGLSAQNPRLPGLRRAFKPMEYATVIETVHWPDEVVTVLDGRPPQPEAALL